MSFTNTCMSLAQKVTTVKPVSSMVLPCDEASDFIGSNSVNDEKTCKDMSDEFALTLPSSLEDCDTEILSGNSMTKADMLKYMHSMCCRRGSKPNSICGFRPSTATPCQSKAEGEFLPEGK